MLAKAARRRRFPVKVCFECVLAIAHFSQSCLAAQRDLSFDFAVASSNSFCFYFVNITVIDSTSLSCKFQNFTRFLGSSFHCLLLLSDAEALNVKHSVFSVIKSFYDTLPTIVQTSFHHFSCVLPQSLKHHNVAYFFPQRQFLSWVLCELFTGTLDLIGIISASPFIGIVWVFCYQFHCQYSKV